MGVLTQKQNPLLMKPMKQVNKIILFFLFTSHYIKSYLHVIMKNESSYTFQHSLLTKEVFIMVLGLSQYEESLIRRIHICSLFV